MNVLIIDPENCGLDFALRAQAAGHTVQLWMPHSADGEMCCIGQGMISRPPEWKPLMVWADLVLPTTNSKYAAELKPYFEKGFPILGANKAGAELELNRELGQQALMDAGIECLPASIFSDYDKAIEFVRSTKKAYVSKPWGGNADKSTTYMSKTPADLIFKLQKWKKEIPGRHEFMLQEKAEGVEMGVAGWFGPGGWGQWIEENWEEKKFLAGGLGCNTGEQGTTMRYVKKSKLFREMLRPLAEKLHAIDYVGCVDVNCIITPKGDVWPLEFTMRFGWPAFVLQCALLQGDPVQWMRDLLDGKDTMQVSQEICVGVVVTHSDYPHGHVPDHKNCGFPLYGINGRNRNSIHFQHVMQGKGPLEPNGEKEVEMEVTAGDYVAVCTGLGRTVRAARDSVYATCKQLSWPNSPGYRPDIGLRLKRELAALKAHGYAEGLEF
jgi:phosphoribosylamine--glycine ligase